MAWVTQQRRTGFPQAISKNPADLLLLLAVKPGRQPPKKSDGSAWPKVPSSLAAELLFPLVACQPALRDELLVRQQAGVVAATALPPPDSGENPAPFLGLLHTFAQTDFGCEELVKARRTVNYLVAYLQCRSSAGSRQQPADKRQQ